MNTIPTSGAEKRKPEQEFSRMQQEGEESPHTAMAEEGKERDNEDLNVQTREASED